jgi:dTDP-glucose pyrophosphorylase
MRRVLALVLAGGKGARLEPLTRDRAKPAVPFGGVYRIIDFTLSNCINSGLRRMLVLTQYKAASLDRHISLGWRFLCRELDEFIDVLPPQQRIDEHWYQGTADAVYQNIYSIEKSRPDLVLILAGDHIYKMDYSEVLQDHIDNQADCTIGCIPVELRESCHFGVMEVDKSQRVVKFLEKPANADPMPDDPNRCLASMGIYVFNASFLFDQLCRDATVTESSHDFGRDIIPTIIETHRVRAFPFRDRNSGNSRYWLPSSRSSTCTTRPGKFARITRRCRRRNSCSRSSAAQTRGPAWRSTAWSVRARLFPAVASSGRFSPPTFASTAGPEWKTASSLRASTWAATPRSVEPSSTRGSSCRKGPRWATTSSSTGPAASP